MGAVLFTLFCRLCLFRKCSSALMLFADIPGSPEHPSDCTKDVAQQHRRELLPSTSQAGNGCDEGGSCFPNVTAFSSGVRQREFPKGTTQLSCHFISWRMGTGLLAVDVMRFLCMLQFSTTHRRIIDICVNQQTRQ